MHQLIHELIKIFSFFYCKQRLNILIDAKNFHKLYAKQLQIDRKRFHFMSEENILKLTQCMQIFIEWVIFFIKVNNMIYMIFILVIVIK